MDDKTQKFEQVQNESFLDSTLMSVIDGVICTDETGCITFMNNTAEKMTGWLQDEAKHKPIDDVFCMIDGNTRERYKTLVHDILINNCEIEIDKHNILISKDGSECLIEECSSPITLEDGGIVGLVIVFRNYSEKMRRDGVIKFLSYNDQLTGLYNRRFYEEELKRLDTIRNLPISLVMADVNGLKLTNDAFGHIAGDNLLKKIAGILKRECRADDILARIGGDEFVILLPQTDSIQVQRIIGRIADRIKAEKSDRNIVSAAIGYSVKQSVMESMHDVFMKAEDDMYRHKLSESERIKRDTIALILKSLYTRNSLEKKHANRVGLLSKEMAYELHYDKEEVKQIWTAGILHDIGNVAIDDGIFQKNRELDASEWHEIMKHPEIGYHILSTAKEFSEVAVYVLQHQEKWDGTGYPKSLKGDEISVPARIISIADAYVSMTSQRPYVKTCSPDQAAEEIRKKAGVQFDPAIARVFVEKILGKEWKTTA